MSLRRTPPPASPPGRRHGWHFRPPRNASWKEEMAPRKAPRDSWSTGLCDPLSIHKKAKKRSNYPAILTEQAWWRIYYMAKKRTSLAGPSREIRRGRILPAWLTNQKVASLREGSPFGRYRKKYTREWHARGDATEMQHSLHLAHSRVKPHNETPDWMRWGAPLNAI